MTEKLEQILSQPDIEVIQQVWLKLKLALLCPATRELFDTAAVNTLADVC